MSSVQSIRFRNIFNVLSVALAVSGLVLSVVLSLVVSRQIISSTAAERCETYEAYLDSIVANTEYKVEILQQSLTHLSKTSGMLHICFSPEPSIRTVAAALFELSSAVAHNYLFESILTYVPSSNMVFTSYYTSGAPEDFPMMNVVRDFYDGNIPYSTLEYDTKIYKLFLSHGHIVIARDYPMSSQRSKATIFGTLNTSRLYRQLTESVGSRDEIWIYDAFDQPVFDTMRAYPEYISPELLEQLRESSQGYRVLGKKTVFFERSAALGWNYIYAVDTASLFPSYGGILLSVAPFMMIVLLVMLALAFFISRYISRPWKRLMDTVEHSYPIPAQSSESSRGGLDYLNYAFGEIAASRSELSSLIQTVSRDVTTRLLSELIAGSLITGDKVTSILKSAQSPFQLNANYIASVLRFSTPLNTMEDHRTVLSAINALMDTFESKTGAKAHALVIDNATIAVILSFAEETSVLYIRKQFTQLSEAVDATMAQMGLLASFRRGHIYHSILDIRFSYREALEAISPASKALEELPANPLSRNALITRAKQVISLLQSASFADAEALSLRILGDVAASGKTTEELLPKYSNFFSALADEIARIEHINLTAMNNDLFVFHADEFHAYAPDELLERARACASALLLELDKRQKKLYNRSLVAAQELIAQRYNDGNLSLGAVAEEIRSNSSYLSKLFTSSLGVTFTDYLNKYRVEQSVRLLESTATPVKDIAGMVGFNSVQHYIRVFKRFKGKSPGQYRDET